MGPARAIRRAGAGNLSARVVLLCGLFAFAGCLSKHDAPCTDASASNCCLSDGDCAGSTKGCNVKTHTCFPGPDAGAGGMDAGADGAGGIGGAGGSGGFACNSATDCHVSTLPACDPSTHTCVACVQSTDCIAGACDTTSHTCVECLVASDCKAPGKKACELSTHTCVGCVGNGNCAAPTAVCNTATKTCVGCLAKGDCSGMTPACDTTTKTCVGCLARSDCSSGTTPACDATSQTCVGCLADTDCSGTKPACDKTTKTCVACSSDDACAAKSPATPVCGSSGACVACKALADSKAHCTTAASPICDAGTNACRACKTDAECATAYGANPGLCVSGQCATDAQVVYVEFSDSCNVGDGSQAKPVCGLSEAQSRLSDAKRIMLVGGTKPAAGAALTPGASPLLIVGRPGSAITSANLAGSISFSSGDVTLRDLTISGNTTGPGVSATGGTLRMTRCQVLNNKSGIETSGAAFDITNTIVAGSLGTGAVTLGTLPPSGPTTFAFNTITANPGTGVFCNASTNYPLANSIVAGNGTTQVSSGCAFTDACATTCSPAAKLDGKYRLQASSTLCIDKAGTTNLPPDDLDGDPRPQGPAADCGADEYKAP